MSHSILVLITGGVALAIVLGMMFIPSILRVAHAKKLFDVPDERKVHTTPIPRLGGYSFLPNIVITLFLTIGAGYSLVGADEGIRFTPDSYGLLFAGVGGLILYLTGVYDDLLGVGYRLKFLVQIISGVLLVLSGTYIDSFSGILGREIPLFIGIFLTIFVVVYTTNALNMIDGIDGLASGLSVIALVTHGILLSRQGDFLFALLAFVTMGAVIPFWGFNVFGDIKRKRKLFMGDTGSLLLGYILSLLAIRIGHYRPEENPDARVTNLILAFTPLIIPMLDVIRLVVVRLRKGRNPFSPDKNHIHHRLLSIGISSRLSMTFILLFSIFLIVLNYFLREYSLGIIPVITIDLVIWGIVNAIIYRSAKKMNA